MKYALLDTRTGKRSRLYTKKTAQRLKQPYHTLITSDECINLGLLVDTPPPSVRQFIPIQMVKGLIGNSDYPIARLHKANTENYEDFCRRNGTIIPL
jgi:hypothetical protein